MPSPEVLTVAYLGNLEPPHSTESEYRHAWESAGHKVVGYQESRASEWQRLIDDVRGGQIDLVQWTSTPGFRHNAGASIQIEVGEACRLSRTPLVGVHLDKFWDIPERIGWLENDPYFNECDIMFTADGGDYPWDKFGINHVWLPPGVSERWCHRGTPREEYTADVCFVGSWQGHYHQTSTHRFELVKRIRRLDRQGVLVKFWPRPHEHAIRGDDLTDLYWSTSLAIGDSFFVGDKPSPGYSSDRLPETLGRGGILLSPFVAGMTGAFGIFDVPAAPVWHVYDWEGFDIAVNEALGWTEPQRTRKRNAAIKYVLGAHTYTRRVEAIIETLKSEERL